jgi:hypothetical protein
VPVAIGFGVALGKAQEGDTAGRGSFEAIVSRSDGLRRRQSREYSRTEVLLRTVLRMADQDTALALALAANYRAGVSGKESAR